MNHLDFAAIRERISIAQVLELLAYCPIEQRGHQWRGSCPLCSASLCCVPSCSVPSCSGQALSDARHFSINVARNVFHCFRCHRSGNQLDLWAATTEQPLYQATLDLCTQLALNPISDANQQLKNTR